MLWSCGAHAGDPLRRRLFIWHSMVQQNADVCRGGELLGTYSSCKRHAVLYDAIRQGFLACM